MITDGIFLYSPFQFISSSGVHRIRFNSVVLAEDLARNEFIKLKMSYSPFSKMLSRVQLVGRESGSDASDLVPLTTRMVKIIQVLEPGQDFYSIPGKLIAHFCSLTCKLFLTNFSSVYTVSLEDLYADRESFIDIPTFLDSTNLVNFVNCDSSMPINLQGGIPTPHSLEYLLSTRDVLENQRYSLFLELLEKFRHEADEVFWNTLHVNFTTLRFIKDNLSTIVDSLIESEGIMDRDFIVEHYSSLMRLFSNLKTDDSLLDFQFRLYLA